VRTNELNGKELAEAVGAILPLDADAEKALQSAHPYDVAEMLIKAALDLYEARIKEFGDETMRFLERVTYLQVLDNLWIEHLEAMDSLRNGIGLRAIGQRDPLVEYKQEGYKMYQNLITVMEAEIASAIFRIRIAVEEDHTGHNHAPVETALTKAAEQASTNGALDAPIAASRARRRQAERSEGAERPRGAGNLKASKKKKKKRK
jgi:preprotein translocase subunit SecA